MFQFYSVLISYLLGTANILHSKEFNKKEELPQVYIGMSFEKLTYVVLVLMNMVTAISPISANIKSTTNNNRKTEEHLQDNRPRYNKKTNQNKTTTSTIISTKTTTSTSTTTTHFNQLHTTKDDFWRATRTNEVLTLPNKREKKLKKIIDM